MVGWDGMRIMGGAERSIGGEGRRRSVPERLHVTMSINKSIYRHGAVDSKRSQGDGEAAPRPMKGLGPCTQQF